MISFEILASILNPKITKRFLQLVLIALMTACADQTVTPREYPVTDTNPVSDINQDGATFNGEILDIGNGVSDHGFVYGPEPNVEPGHSDRISLGAMDVAGKFTAFANRGMRIGLTYYVRAFAVSKTNGLLVLGQTRTFVSQGTSSFEVKELSPLAGVIGDTVLITGSGFSNVMTNNIVRFGTLTTSVINAGTDSLQVYVPLATPVGESVVSVQIGQITQSLTAKFNLRELELISFSPELVSIGDTIVVIGNNFVPAHLSVSMFTQLVHPFKSTNDMLQLVVPHDMSTAKSPLKLTLGSQSVQSTDSIRLQVPIITEFNPNQGGKDTEVIITGNHFNPEPNYNYVSIAGKTLQVVAASPSQLKVRMASGIAPGEYPISVAVAGQTVLSAILFKIIKPEIADVQPTNGTWGDVVTITGKNFGASITENIVHFGQAEAIVTQASTTELKVIVPDALLVVGSLISVQVKTLEDRSDTTATSFVLDPPQVTSFSPNGGKSESVVTLTGTNFHPIKANNVVTFGTMNSEVIDVSPTQLMVKVPKNLADTLLQINLTVAGQSATALNLFHSVAPWRRLTDFPGSPRFYATSFTIDGYGYVGLGYEPQATTLAPKKFWKYDPATDAWSEIKGLTLDGFGTTLPYPGTASFVIGSNAYVTGFDRAPSPQVRKYDSNLDEWSGVAAASSTLGKNVTYSIDGKGYVITGRLSGPTKSAWQYDPDADTWTFMGEIPGQGRQLAFGFTLGSKAYVMGGLVCNCVGQMANDNWEYTPATNQWLQRTNVPGSARYAASGFALGGKGFVVGGVSYLSGAERNIAEVLSYDPVNHEWVRLDDFPGGPVSGGSIFVVANKAYFVTGKKVWEFDPSKL